MCTWKNVMHQIKEAGGVLIRRKKHSIYKFPNGKIISVSSTPSDRRAVENVLQTLRKQTRSQ